MRGSLRVVPACLLIAWCAGLACRSDSGRPGPAVTFDQVPEAAAGGTNELADIAGRVTGAAPDQRVVLFARTEGWWVQPLASDPFTTIASDGTWRNRTHLGAEYGAVLVEPGYQPPPRTDALPGIGNGVLASATIAGRKPAVAVVPSVVHFSGYDWTVRHASSDRGGAHQAYDPRNVTVDGGGALRMRISGSSPAWRCSEVMLNRSLGYGTYTFVVGDTSHLEPAAALSLFTWDYQGLDQGQREMDIEISRWGDPASRNAQFVVQPYYVPANVVRFVAPAGRLTHSMRWEPGRAAFRTVRGANAAGGAAVVAQHEFTSGVPIPGTERVRMNLYFFRYAPEPPRDDVEIVIEKFEYLP